MEKIKIITDSTCDLPNKLLKELGVEVVPLTVNINAKSYRDGIDINFDDLNNIITKYEDFPTTSQANPDLFKEVYERYLSRGYKIISIHISGKFSSTCQSALIAKDILDTQDIIIYDSLNVSGGLGILVVEAAEMVKNGYKLEEICEKIEEAIPNIRSCVVLNDISNLVMAGRVNKTVGKFANIIGIKPVLGVVDGELTLIGKIRGNKKLVEYLTNFIDNCNLDHNSKIYLLYSQDDAVLEFLKTYIDNKGYKYYIIHVGCVVGAYCGGRCNGVFIKSI